ncbi:MULTISPECIES: hypothetical protein [Vibrio]|uniref:hypothetical protein n=1 Tax=Vibrio TaxID=662 RepID=UPI0002AE3C8A|nr:MULTISPECIES: hypothetical protein [Vibrio]HDM8042859.1 hypothetical protein [Vibrio campbellii]ARV75282.1 hypothetical protein A8140_22005 [Vibrio campbellii CAIM 519 = NBRC 15631 = ATCC 25920]ELU52336.1 hypothetical protein B878_08405 [Vibrio campbellii CAIM 519 = NBRC 15631 = ATCC 25920]MCG7514732.1 hypothetical protein [Vibrio sp. MMH1-50]HDM8046861.1 hypothetical protein [Vibrio campbellii]
MKLLHLQLFWYEKHHTLLEMEDLPILTPAQEQELREWAKTRRKILSYEVHQQPWVKVNVDGFSSILELKPNGTLVEKDLFSERGLQGLWKVSDGFLFIKVISGEFIVEYQIVGNTENNVHSGIEYINGKISTYSKFAKLANN